MKLSIAQIDSTIGDFSGNIEKIIAFSKKALKAQGPGLVLFPELALCGYPPMDLLDQDIFVEMNLRSLRILQRELPPELAVGTGYVSRNPDVGGKALVNAYGIILDGALVFEQFKTLLPTYDVFDEARNFESAKERKVFTWQGERIGFAICEDVWRETETPGTRYIADPAGDLFKLGISLLCVPSASPYYAGKLKVRLKLAERISRRGNVPLAYINAVGANDSIIFDGRSFIAAPSGTGSPGDDAFSVEVSARAFEEDIVSWDTALWTRSMDNGPVRADAVSAGATTPSAGAATPSAGAAAPSAGAAAPSAGAAAGPAKRLDEVVEKAVGLSEGELDTLEDALVMGIRGYMKKCGFTRAHVGLSGGIDSALVAYLAVRAVGADKVVCFGMPSRFSSQGSKDDAERLAANLGCRFEILPIEGPFEAFLKTLAGVFEERPFDLAEENLQARIRGTLLMAYSNKFGSMLLTTGNKSELAMGYCTLYGDMNGALGPIGDLFKTEVFALCRRINRRIRSGGETPPIPEAILTKAPSAELRPNQKDQDSLPPYEILDEVLKLYLFENKSKKEIIEKGWDPELAARVIKTVARAEFKRRQAPPVLKVSPRAFGMGRRMPIARYIYEV
ncbi:MAG: NAD+ synthase [Spirochaetaceae bacterium]|jgi:NAD+ synthase (glutamine-hydrolysing)|nr:NAD+ synthase [Spirochaetaceae bacterium]